MGVIARVGMLRDIGSWRNLAVFALAVMAMFASAPKAGAGFVCSSSTVHILFDSGSSECVGASGTADTSISYGTPALAGDAIQRQDRDPGRRTFLAATERREPLCVYLWRLHRRQRGFLRQ